MKKIALAVLMATGAGASFNAMAAGTNITTNPITQTMCPLLGEPVVINLSKNVSGAWQCEEITTTIRVAACHAAGSRKAKTVQCTGEDTDLDGVLDKFSPTGCADANSTVDIADYTAFGGTSKGGSLGTYELGANCTDGSVAGITLFQ